MPVHLAKGKRGGSVLILKQVMKEKPAKAGFFIPFIVNKLFHNTKIIEDLLMKLSQQYTIVVVTHNLQQARRIADYTTFFLGGKLIEMNTTEALFTNPQEEETQQYLQGLFG